MSDTRYPRLAYDNQGDVGIDAPLQSGGGGSTFDPMEARVSKLEAGYDKLREDIAEVRTGLAVLTERVNHLPTKGFIVTATVAALAFFTAIVMLQDKVAAFLAG